MSCYHPLKAYYRLRDDGKKDIVFVDDNSLPSYERDGIVYHQKIEIPCGQCVGCRLDYSRQWAIRCMLEASQWKNNYFVTLTYDDAHLSSNVGLQMQSYGDIVSPVLPTLVKKDPSDFIKRLRSYIDYHYFNFYGDGTSMRVYYCGEYGSKTNRPHYHLILFNCPDFPLTEWCKDKQGFSLFNCSVLEKCWKKGFVVVGEVTFESCAYVARYVMKKQKGLGAEKYLALNIQPEFVEMSRRPGIGKTWYDLHKYDKCYDNDEISMKLSKGKSGYVKPPKYFDRLFEYDDPELLAELKSKRCFSAQNRMKNELKSTSLSFDEYLKMKEENKLFAISKLTRSLE